MSDLTKLTAEELLADELTTPFTLWMAEIRRRLERLEKCETTLKQTQQALNSLIPFAEHTLPDLPHKGSCGPEAGCDAICMEFSLLSAIIRLANIAEEAARAALEGK